MIAKMMNGAVTIYSEEKNYSYNLFCKLATVTARSVLS